jgi:hypothetical protein
MSYRFKSCTLQFDTSPLIFESALQYELIFRLNVIDGVRVSTVESAWLIADSEVSELLNKLPRSDVVVWLS